MMSCPSHKPSASLKVLIPLSAEMPAPLKITKFSCFLLDDFNMSAAEFVMQKKLKNKRRNKPYE